MAQFDILLSSTTDLQADVNGDFVTGDATNNLMAYIIASPQGAYKEFPLMGVGIYQFVNSTASPVAIQSTIKNQLKADVFKNVLVDASQYPTIKINDLSVTLG